MMIVKRCTLKIFLYFNHVANYHCYNCAFLNLTFHSTENFHKKTVKKYVDMVTVIHEAFKKSQLRYRHISTNHIILLLAESTQHRDIHHYIV